MNIESLIFHVSHGMVEISEKLMICIRIPEAFLASRHAGALACCLHTEPAVMLHARDDNSLCET